MSQGSIDKKVLKSYRLRELTEKELDRIMSYTRLVSIDHVNKIIVCGDFITSHFNKCLE